MSRLLGSIAALAFLVCNLPSSMAGGLKHPHLHHALREMREARVELKEAAHDFGGHRVEAIGAIDRALEQLEVCLKFDK